MYCLTEGTAYWYCIYDMFRVCRPCSACSSMSCPWRQVLVTEIVGVSNYFCPHTHGVVCIVFVACMCSSKQVLVFLSVHLILTGRFHIPIDKSHYYHRPMYLSLFVVLGCSWWRIVLVADRFFWLCPLSRCYWSHNTLGVTEATTL
jgi:hypothetical protein